MSGILLSGQENKPQPEGQAGDDASASGLILPKGYSSKQEKSDVQADAADTAADDASADDTGAEQPADRPSQSASAGAGQPQMNFKYPPGAAQVSCPSCGTPYNAAVFTIIDLGENPELLSPLLSGQVNAAMCPNCGVGGALSAPLLVHHPEEEFLGAFIPSQGQVDDIQNQKIIGDLTSRLMRDLPTEARKGYLLQPQQFFDWGRLIEVLWGFEGVTPEMLRRNADQRTQIQNLLKLVNDDSALKIAADRAGDLIDKDFFTMLEQMVMTISSQGQREAAQGLQVLREKLIEMTPAGEEVKMRQERAQELLEQISTMTSHADLLTLIVDTWQEEDGEDLVGAVVAAAAPAFDYQFLMLLSERVDGEKDDETRARLEELRGLIVQIQTEQQQSQQAQMQQVQALLQEILQAEDPGAVMRQYAPAIDQTFLALLAANIKSAEENNATAAVSRLKQIYTIALKIFDESLPPEMRLMQQLAAAPDSAGVKKLLNENRELLTPEFVEMLGLAEEQIRGSGNAEQADKIKTIRGQVALMV